MKKKLLALAITGAFAAPVAIADTANVNIYGVANRTHDVAPVSGGTANVNIYGVANLSFDMTNNGTTTAGVAGTSTNKVSSNVSRIGFKGNEDLGGGTSAIWQIEQQINIDNSTTNANTFANRNTFLGLSGASWGTVLLGRHDTPYKIATRGLDLFADTVADNRSLMGGASLTAAQLAAAALPAGSPGALGASAATSFDGRQGDVVAYISPAMSGFTAVVAYVAGAEAATLSTNVKGAAWSLAGMYNAGPFNGSLAYEVHDFGTTTPAATGTLGPLTGAALGNLANTKESAWKLGAGYSVDAFAVNFAYEKTKDNFAGGANADLFGHHAYYLAGKYNVNSNDAVKLAYTKMGDLNAAGVAANQANTGASQIALGYDHATSKRTTVYALYTKLNNNTAANYGFTTATSTSGGANLGAGADPSVWSLGMKHTF